MSNVYEALGVPTVINAVGPSTRLSGGIMHPEVAAAMAAAGGLTELANPKKVTVRRGGKTIELDYQSLSREGQKFAIQPGDIISIARRIF